MKAKDIRRHGDLVPIGELLCFYACLLLTICIIQDESQPVKLIMRALPGIEQFVSQKLAQYTLD
jgi:histone deacetylase 6